MTDFDGKILRINPATRDDGLKMFRATHTRDVVDRPGRLMQVGTFAETTKVPRFVSATHTRDVVDRAGGIMQIGDD